MSNTTPQRVLVTGGAGLIGSHIVDLLMDGREQGKYGEIVISITLCAVATRTLLRRRPVAS